MDLLDNSSFWVPSFMPESGWTEHAPFAFWVVGQLRPGVIVELGVHHGYSYFAMCEAVQRHGLTSRCYGVDTWQGDVHAGFYGDDVYNTVEDHNTHYAAFSTLIRSSFDDALGQFADGSIDLLHIDGRHYYDDVKHDFETWRPKLSNRGVVLLHDTNVRERDFGVFRFFEELRDRYKTFEFVHGHGLGVVAVGDELSPTLDQLFAAPQQAAESYVALGASLTERANSVRLATERDQLATERDQLASERDALVSQRDDLTARIREDDSRIAEYENSTSWKLTAPARGLGRRVRSRARSRNGNVEPESDH